MKKVKKAATVPFSYNLSLSMKKVNKAATLPFGYILYEESSYWL